MLELKGSQKKYRGSLFINPDTDCGCNLQSLAEHRQRLLNSTTGQVLYHFNMSLTWAWRHGLCDKHTRSISKSENNAEVPVLP